MSLLTDVTTKIAGALGQAPIAEQLHAAPIEDYALIGDCETAALICRNGSIDWLCWPNFASSAVFAGLLGTSDHGFFQIRPSPEEAVLEDSWRYLPKTLIVEKTWRTLDGEVLVTDFMPPRDRHSDIVRIVRCVRGTVKMRMDLVMRFDYGCTIPWVTHVENHVRAVAGPHLVVLRTSAPVRGEDMRTVSDFTVKEGESVCFALSYGSSLEPDPESFDANDALRDTADFWTGWISQNTTDGDAEFHEAVERSLITLKAMTYRPSGGLVAAVTMALPEKLGGKRNWDYRYCWIRDTAFTLLVLLNSGFTEEARQWRGWLLRAMAGAPEQMRALYGINAEQVLAEWEIKWLPGYEHSKPVLVGNAASEQLQIDIFGEAIAALSRTPVNDKDMWSEDVRKLAEGILRHLGKIWREPDNGIWETRSERKHFVHSKVMAWSAFDRAIQSFQERHRDSQLTAEESDLLAQWTSTRDEIREDILEHGFNKKLNSFVQSYGSEHLDAACLRIPLVGFLPGDDPRVLGTLDALEQKLMHDGLMLRYDTEGDKDGLPPGEGAFLACSFWFAGALHVAGRREQASQYFRHLLTLRNDLGLLAEEYDTDTKRQLGNFPQALSHLALCHTAIILSDSPGPWNGKAVTPVEGGGGNH